MILVLSATFGLLILTTQSIGSKSTNGKSWDPLAFESQKLDGLYSIENNNNNLKRDNRQTTVWGGSPSSFQNTYYPSQSLNGQNTIWGGRGNDLSYSSTTWGGTPRNYQSSYNGNYGNLNQGTVWGGQPSYGNSYYNPFPKNNGLSTVWGGNPVSNSNQGWDNRPVFQNINNPIPRSNGQSTTWGGKVSSTVWGGSPSVNNANLKSALWRENPNSYQTDFGSNQGVSFNRRIYNQSPIKNIPSATVWGASSGTRNYQTNFNTHPEATILNRGWFPTAEPPLLANPITPTAITQSYNQPFKNIPSTTVWGGTPRGHQSFFNTIQNPQVSSAYSPFGVANEPLRVALPESVATTRTTLWHEIPVASPSLSPSFSTPTLRPRPNTVYNSGSTVWGGAPRNYQTHSNTNINPEISLTYDPFVVVNEPLRLALPESVATTRTTLWHEIPTASPSPSPSIITPTPRPYYDPISNSGATFWGGASRNYQTPYNTNRNAVDSSTYNEVVKPTFRVQLPESVTPRTIWHELPTAAPTFTIPQIPLVRTNNQQPIRNIPSPTVWGGTLGNYPDVFNNNQAYSEQISTISPTRWFQTSTVSPVPLPSPSTPIPPLPQIFSESLVNNYQSINPGKPFEAASAYNPLGILYAPFSPVSTTGPIPQLPLTLEQISSQPPIPVFTSPKPNILSSQHSRIIHQNSESSPQGYSYSYATDNGIKAGEEGMIAEYDPLDNIGTRVQGFYEYIDTNGDTIRVEYTADENGFRPISKRIPLIAGPTLLPSLPLISPLPTASISTLSPVPLSSPNVDPLAIMNMASSTVSDLLTLTHSPNGASPFPTYPPLISPSDLSAVPPQMLLDIGPISTPISTIDPLLLPITVTPSELPVVGYTTASPLDVPNISTISPLEASNLSPIEVASMVASAVGSLLSLTSPTNPSLPNAAPATYQAMSSFSPLDRISPAVPSLSPNFETPTVTYYIPTNAIPPQLPAYTPTPQVTQFRPSLSSNNLTPQELITSASPSLLPTISYPTPSNLLTPSQLPPAIPTLSPLEFSSSPVILPPVLLPSSYLPPSAISTLSPEGFYPFVSPPIGPYTPQYPLLYSPDLTVPKLGTPSSPNTSPGSSTSSTSTVPSAESTTAPVPSTSEISSEQRTPPPRIKFPGQKYPPSSVDKLTPISLSPKDNSTPSTSNEGKTSETVTYEYLPVGPDASDLSQKKPPKDFVLTPSDEISTPSQAAAVVNDDILSPSSTPSAPLESLAPLMMMNDGLSMPLQAMLPITYLPTYGSPEMIIQTSDGMIVDTPTPQAASIANEDISSPSSSLSPPFESPPPLIIMDGGLSIPLEAMLPMTYLPSDGNTNNGVMDISIPTPKEEISPFTYLPSSSPISPMSDGSPVMGIDASPSSPVSSSPIQDTNEVQPEIDAQPSDETLSAEASLPAFIPMNQDLSPTILPPSDNSSPINLMDVTDTKETSVPTDGNLASSNPLEPNNSQPPSSSLEALEEFSLVSSLFNNII